MKQITGVEDHNLQDAANHRPAFNERDEEHNAAIGGAIRDVLYAHNQSLADRIFERIEKGIADVVGDAAKRVVPKNIRGLIETVVTLRTARLSDEIHHLRDALAESEARLSREIARTIETPFPDPTPQPKARKRRKKIIKAKPRR